MPSTGDPTIGSCPEGLKSHVFSKEAVKQLWLSDISQLLLTNLNTIYGPGSVGNDKNKLKLAFEVVKSLPTTVSIHSDGKSMKINPDSYDEVSFPALYHELR